MKFLIAGAGSIGQRHLRNLRALGHEVLVWDADPDQRNAAGALCGTVVASLDAGLERAPDGLLVCTPPASHLAIATQGLLRDVHVFLEKPLAVDSSGADELIALARKRNRVMLVGCNLRFFRSLRRVKSLLEAERIGRVLSVRADCGFYLPSWRPGRDYRQTYSARASAGGGILLDAIHEFAIATALLEHYGYLPRGVVNAVE